MLCVYQVVNVTSKHGDMELYALLQRLTWNEETIVDAVVLPRHHVSLLVQIKSLMGDRDLDLHVDSHSTFRSIKVPPLRTYHFRTYPLLV